MFGQTKAEPEQYLKCKSSQIINKIFETSVRNVRAPSFPLVMEILWSICLRRERERSSGQQRCNWSVHFYVLIMLEDHNQQV